MLVPIAHTLHSSSSGTGVSYWSSAARCGRYANLSAKRKIQRMGADESKINGMLAGTHYHTLHQLWHDKSLANSRVFELGSADINFEAAVFAFQEYRKFRNKDYFGETIGCELKFPTNKEDADFLAQCLGGPFTKRLDRLVRLNNTHIDRLCLDFPELQLMPGLYILDYKLQRSHNVNDEWTFGWGLQAKSYVAVYNLLACRNGWEPVSGMLFDVMTRPAAKGATLNNFRVYQSKALPNDLGILKAVVQVGRNNLNLNLVNPVNCITAYGPCYFLRSNQCNQQSSEP